MRRTFGSWFSIFGACSRRTSGQSIVEMALVLPFLVLITLGIIEFGYYVYTYSELENATRRASERASKTPPIDPNNPADLCLQLIKLDAMQGGVLNQLDESDIAVSFVGGGSNPRTVGNQIQIDLSHDGKFLTPVGQGMFGNIMRFRFTSRRTIVSLDPPPGFDSNCQPTSSNP